MNNSQAYFANRRQYTDKHLHPVWAFVLMKSFIDAAILVGIYSTMATGWLRPAGVVVIGLLLVAAWLTYRTT